MAWQRGQFRRGSWLLAAMLLPALSGCLSCMHPAKVTSDDPCESCQTMPDDCHDHVHIFLVHGVNPHDCANLKGVRDHLTGLGYKNVYLGPWWNACAFKDKIAEIDRCDPEARFAVIGSCEGACVAQKLCERSTEETVPVHMLIFLDGCGIREFRCKPSRKQPVIVNIIAPGLLYTTPMLQDADNITLCGAWRYGAAMHPATLDRLEYELAELAESVTLLPMPNAAPKESPQTVPPIADVVYQASRTQRSLLREMAGEAKEKPEVATKPAAKPPTVGIPTSNPGKKTGATEGEATPPSAPRD